ncbi:MAG: hypothetical protein U1E04_00420 [Hylemonella sp.]|nr:hypothetical protein [Hylemonella sp.]
MTTKRLTQPVVTGLLLLAGISIGIFWFITSLDEMRFLRRLRAATSAGAADISLPELMHGDWELVCESHGYDGPLYLARYNKTFDPVAPSQDGVWGLIFIAKDSSYRSAVASCQDIGVRLSTNGCTERDKAILRRETNSSGCIAYSVKPEPTSPAIKSKY